MSALATKHAQFRNALVAFLVLVASASSLAQVQALGLLARGSLARGAMGRSAAADLSWLGREVMKSAIEQAISSNGTMQQELGPSNCLVVEFDGYRNHIGNFCNFSIAFDRIVLGTGNGGAVLSTCTRCTVQPGQILTLSPEQGSAIGPALAVAQQDRQTGQGGQLRGEPSPGAGQLKVRVLRSNYGNLRASAILEIENPSPLAIGLVAETASIFNLARASIHTQCGSEYRQGPPYDALAGISKSPESPTWIPPNGSIRVSYSGDLRNGASDCALTYVTIDVQVFRAGVAAGQSTTIFADVN